MYVILVLTGILFVKNERFYIEMVNKNTAIILVKT